MRGHLTTKALLITEHFSSFVSASQKRESPFVANEFKKLSKPYKFGEKSLTNLWNFERKH